MKKFLSSDNLLNMVSAVGGLVLFCLFWAVVVLFAWAVVWATAEVLTFFRLLIN